MKRYRKTFTIGGLLVVITIGSFLVPELRSRMALAACRVGAPNYNAPKEFRKNWFVRSQCLQFSESIEFAGVTSFAPKDEGFQYFHFTADGPIPATLRGSIVMNSPAARKTIRDADSKLWDDDCCFVTGKGRIVQGSVMVRGGRARMILVQRYTSAHTFVLRHVEPSSWTAKPVQAIPIKFW